VARLFIDESLCQARGKCYALQPKVFSSDEDGYAEAAGVGWVEIQPDRLEQARAAERACPEAAIRVIEDA
jgi:ferredoxin